MVGHLAFSAKRQESQEEMHEASTNIGIHFAAWGGRGDGARPEHIVQQSQQRPGNAADSAGA
jgi:hypothetical protein